MSKDYYKTLGVDKKASKDEIKKAFHKLAHKYHPDKKTGDEAKFKEVNEAYQVLSNEKKRAEYDTYGQTFSGSSAGQGGFGGFSGFQGQQGFDFGNIDLDDIFSAFTGSGFSGGGNRARRGRDISTELTISFKESIFGVTRKVLLTKNSACATCHGSGAAEGSGMATCPQCNGQGQIQETKRSILGSFASVKTCETCLGKGKVPEKKCSICKGAGITRGQEEITLDIPAGIENGQMIRMTGAGDAVQNGQSGDLYIKVNVQPDKTFSRRGYDLTMNLDIKLTDALLGAEYTITTLDNRNLSIKIPKGIALGETLRVKKEGVPMSASRRGDLLIKTNVKLPSKLSKKTQKIVEELRDEGV